MKAIMVMYDSLNRHMLPPYGCDWVKAPNFSRLAELAATFDTCYVGSMPTIPARREHHTGRYNFLHRGWGPIEPFDDSAFEMLHKSGVATHLASDGYHYWEDGASTYHNRYSNWQFFRGQEGDAWQGDVGDPDIPNPNPGYGFRNHQDWVNRAHMQNEADQPQAKSFAAGVDLMKRNRDQDNWFLQIETFDPHEPYFCNQEFKDLYDFDFSKVQSDWPSYDPVDEIPPELAAHFRHLNGALISMCDKYLGKVLDAMDELALWDDTLLIVTTDHGFLLGEHGWFGKCRMPFYDEIARIPLFIWDPRCKVRGERRRSLAQAIDVGPTLLEYFGVDRTPDMQGVPLRETVADDTPVREAGLFGVHGGHVNVTDGRHVYMRAPATTENRPLFNYTLMPTHMRGFFSVDEMRTMQWREPFAFTKGCPVMKVQADPGRWVDAHEFGNLLFDTEADPRQEEPPEAPAIAEQMIAHMVRLMKETDAPPEQYERLGLAPCD